MTDTPRSLFVSQVFQRAFAEHCRRQKRPKNFTVKVHKIAASRKLPLIFAGMMELVDMRDLGAVTLVKGSNGFLDDCQAGLEK